MKFHYATNYGTWDKRDYKNRVVIAVYNKELVNWLVTQDSPDIEVYGDPSYPYSRVPVIVVGVPDKLYTMLALKW